MTKENRKPWPWYCRLRIRSGLNWELFPYSPLGNSDRIRDWIWSPYFKMTKRGDEISYKDFPAAIGSHFTLDEPNFTGSLRANYFFLGMALRIIGIDVGFEILYRYKDAY
ncbi:hypothetical protein [Caulobacter phage Cr30]|uniref:hypothetical protein n=1 Tax=Caulobacter phage Cr30 TaxID=1357714 RepID=UPI0004A9BA61|nr:hypothetical protein OZ74_gp099 [Caulobacter phage Cr30]AGS80984.1 hypothetical protein [Caulobacter phage Cr30]